MRVKSAILAITVFLALGSPLAICTQSATPAEATATRRADPVEPFAWLVGGVWTADASKINPAMLRIETQYSWSDNHRFLRFTTHFVSTRGTLKNYDGNMYWDPARKALRIWYLSASGEITDSPVTLNGDRWQMDFAGTDFDDNPAQLRVIVDRKSPYLYHWALSKQAGEGWKPLLDLDYTRK